MSCHRVIVLVLVLGACQSNGTKPSEPSSNCATPDGEAFIDANHRKYLDAISRARRWLDALDIDPIALRKYGVKGKKKLTEQLDTYYRLSQIAEPAERAALLARIKEVVAITYEPRFHDLGDISDKQFKQDATSYLRAALLMERLGLDTQLYRDEIRKIQPRLDAHMKSRGPHQQLAFHWYYEHFGLAEPFPLAAAREAGMIARRVNVAKFKRDDVYDLTHEVFVPYEFGEKLDVDPFSAEDKAYLLPALSVLLARFIVERDVDLAAELVSCMRMLRFTEEPVYREGLDYLLTNQHEDGSWGDVERAEHEFGDQAPEAMILHTTMVVIDALAFAFHSPWNPPRGCPGSVS